MLTIPNGFHNCVDVQMTWALLSGYLGRWRLGHDLEPGHSTGEKVPG